MKNKLKEIVSFFKIDGKVKKIQSLDEGFINDTFFIQLESSDEYSYILQRKNSFVFKDVPGMMNNIYLVTEHLRMKVINGNSDLDSKSFSLVKTRNGDLFYRDSELNYWVIFSYIRNSRTFQKVETSQIAYQAGIAIGQFQYFLSDLCEPLIETIPGFHNIKDRFAQWDKALKDNPLSRVSELKTEIEWIESRRIEMLTFFEKIENGYIPQRIAHNDTKISNVLFDQNGKFICMIDLDTVMRSTVLYDFGDAVRTYTNTGYEDDKNLKNISMDLELYKAFVEGYLSHAGSFLTKTEIELLAYSALYITFEQVLRFLMDYIQGDCYYKIKYPKHNYVRTHAQYELLLSFERNFPKMNEVVFETAKECK